VQMIDETRFSQTDGMLPGVMRLSLLVAFILVCMAAGRAAAEDADERASREAKQLFSIMLAHDPECCTAVPQPFAPKRCELDASWSEIKLPEYVARKHFGFQLHADLSASTNTKFRDVIDPQRKFDDAFCTAEEKKNFHDDAMREFQNNNSPFVHISHTSFSFPIFDTSYRKAIVIFSRWGSSQRDKSVGARRAPFYGHTDALIYVKTGGEWKYVANESIEEN